MRTVRLQVRLREVDPPVLRVLDVPAAVVLPELHELLQAAMGWTDSHLHEFLVPAPAPAAFATTASAGTDDAQAFPAGSDSRRVPATGASDAADALDDAGTPAGFPDLYTDPDAVIRYGLVDADWCDELDPTRDEAAVRLAQLGARFVYHYDFGDSWQHEVTVLGPGAEHPGCVYGEGACPPEDCGGPCGYAETLAALADPHHPEHTAIRDWIGDPGFAPDRFDRPAADLLVRQTVGQVPESVRLLLDLLAGGVRLTQTGRLPRTVVHQMQHHRPDWAYDTRPARSEDDLPALAELHQLLRRVGLARPNHGTLRPTRAATDDLQILRRLRRGLGPDTGFTAQLATDAIGLLAATGPRRLDELAGHLHPLLAHGWTRAGQPLTATDIRHELAALGALLHGLDLITHTDRWGSNWAPGPSARWLLPRATALADYWTRHPPT